MTAGFLFPMPECAPMVEQIRRVMLDEDVGDPQFCGRMNRHEYAVVIDDGFTWNECVHCSRRERATL